MTIFSKVDSQHLAEEFCRWPLPEGVAADQCACDPKYAYPRSGTNLLTVDQAKMFFDHLLASGLLDGTPSSGGKELVDQWRVSAERLARDYGRLRKAGAALVSAATYVVHDYDGLHRLSAAIAAYSDVLASEGGRPSPAAPPAPVPAWEVTEAAPSFDPGMQPFETLSGSSVFDVAVLEEGHIEGYVRATWDLSGRLLSEELDLTNATSQPRAHAALDLLTRVDDLLHGGDEYASLAHGLVHQAAALLSEEPVIREQAKTEMEAAQPRADASVTEALDDYGPGRCEVCGWPLAESQEKGCIPGDCSYRPDGAEWERIKRRRAALAAREVRP